MNRNKEDMLLIGLRAVESAKGWAKGDLEDNRAGIGKRAMGK